MLRPDNAVKPKKRGHQLTIENIEWLEKKACSGGGMLPQDILMFIHKKMEDDAEGDILEKNKAEWEHGGRVLDRFLLVMSFVVITAMSAAYILAMMG